VTYSAISRRSSAVNCQPCANIRPATSAASTDSALRSCNASRLGARSTPVAVWHEAQFFSKSAAPPGACAPPPMTAAAHRAPTSINHDCLSMTLLPLSNSELHDRAELQQSTEQNLCGHEPCGTVGPVRLIDRHDRVRVQRVVQVDIPLHVEMSERDNLRQPQI